MKAIIMAAGQGTRIKGMINDLPKCLIPINNEPLLCHSIRLLKKFGIDDITIVVGYQKNQVIDALKRFKDLNFVSNDDYLVTNGIYSIWLAKNHISEDDDTILMSGDLYITSQILTKLLATKKDPVLLTDSARKLCADFKFGYENDVLRKYGKELSVEETDGECLGIGKMTSSFGRIYKQKLESLIRNGVTNLWWESVFYEMINEYNIYVEDVDGLFWGEVDTYNDYLRIQKFLNDEKD